MLLRRSTIASAITSSLVAHGPAFGQASPPADPPALKEVTVTATRTERRVDEVPATVTVIPVDEIGRSNARDIKDLLRHEIDVTVRAGATRFTAAGSSFGRAGNEGINIRGLEGNQVLLLVDGIRVPNAFSFGAFATGRGDFLNIDAAQAIEVLRGPASTQYGSDGLAGVVALRTLEAADLLAQGQTLGGAVKLGYASVDKSWLSGAGLAFRHAGWEGLLNASARKGHETANQGSSEAPNSSRTAPNPLDYEAPSVLGKLRYAIDAAHSVGVTLDAQRRRQDTDVISARAVPPFPPATAATSVLDLDARDRLERTRVSVEHRYTDPRGAWIQRAQTQLYHQRAEVRQFSTEDRNTAPDRTRDNRYEQDVTGLSTQLENSFGTGALSHRLSYGVDASRSEVTGVRDGTVPPFGETFPTKPFPDTRYTLAGAFVQDEIETGPLTLFPALRFDRYKLSPSADGYSGGVVVALSDQAVTPRLGVVWRLAEDIAPYAQWARGFRAPTPDQVNNGFTNLASNYRSIGNPNLKPERAESFEAGVRLQAGPVKATIAGFDNRYQDFISQEVVSGNGTAANPTVFQFINLARARIRGIELRARWRIDAAWTLNAGSALTRGYATEPTGTTPLDTIEPLRTVLGLGYAAGAWTFDATVLHAQAKGADRINPIPTQTGTTPAFASPSSTVLDLAASWRPLPRLTLVAGVNNVFDRTYWRWSDVRGVADSSTVKDAYTAPGRNASVSARYQF